MGKIFKYELMRYVHIVGYILRSTRLLQLETKEQLCQCHTEAVPSRIWRIGPKTRYP